MFSGAHLVLAACVLHLHLLVCYISAGVDVLLQFVSLRWKTLRIPIAAAQQAHLHHCGVPDREAADPHVGWGRRVNRGDHERQQNLQLPNVYTRDRPGHAGLVYLQS